jgi:DNA-binding transcriptional LysR family regulator
VFFDIEPRLLRAVITVAEELSFTRAAQKLHITQPALSKQIADLEERYGFKLFSRSNKRDVQLTDAGRVLVERARSALTQIELGIRLAQAAHEGNSSTLMVGYSPYADHAWVSTLLAIQLHMFPELHVSTMTMFAMELFRSVLAGELSLALVTAPAENAQIAATQFAQAPLYAALLETHPAIHNERLVLSDLANDNWILFARQVHPMVHDAILDTASRAGIVPRKAHDIMGVRQAIHLVSEGHGIAILTKPMALEIHSKGIVVKALFDKPLSFPTCLIRRVDDKSRLTKEFAHAFLSRFANRPPAPAQLELPLSIKDNRLA